MSFLELQGVEKHFGALRAIKGVNLTVEKGEFVVFVGPSGCGKSTLLRMIAGLTDIDGGRLLLDGRDITRLASSKRDLAMVFQSYALYPHMSVRDNMSFALRLAHVERKVIDDKVRRAAEILEAARMDGASIWGEFWNVIRPLALGTLASTGLLCLVLSWNEAFWSLNISAARAGTLATLIASYSSPEGLFWAKLSAASLMAIAPIVVVGWFSQKQLVQGLTFGAVK